MGKLFYGDMIKFRRGNIGTGKSEANIEWKRAKIVDEYKHFYVIELEGICGNWKETILKKDIITGQTIIKKVG